MTEPAPDRIVDARARHARPPAALLHRVRVTERGPAGSALCDTSPRSGWTLDPVWPDKRCPACEAAYEAQEAGSG